MKIRSGFVSNSSSSSFICDYCGNVESGWDLGLIGAEMCQCSKEHILCTQHVFADPTGLPSKEELTTILNDRLKRNPNYKEALLFLDSCETSKQFFTEYANQEGTIDEINKYEILENIGETLCPICNLKRITDDLKVRYALHLLGISNTELEEQIKSHGSMDSVYNFLKKKQSVEEL